MVINEKDIELSKPNRFPPITVKQGDNARQITARLFNDGEQFLVTSGLGIRLNAKRSDGQKNYSTGWVNDDGTVTVQITSWMLAVVGMVTCDISVFLNGQQSFTTTNFYLNVEEATNKDGVVGGNDTPIDEQFAEISLQIEGYLNQARQYAEQASKVDHIIEQNSGIPVKVWTTNDKKEFEDLETKQPDTLYIYPDDVDIKRDENGVLKIGDMIIPQKKLLWSGSVDIGTGIEPGQQGFYETNSIKITSSDRFSQVPIEVHFKFSENGNVYRNIRKMSANDFIDAGLTNLYSDAFPNNNNRLDIKFAGLWLKGNELFGVSYYVQHDPKNTYNSLLQQHCFITAIYEVIE